MFKSLRQNAEIMTFLAGVATTGVIGLSFGSNLFFQSRYRKLIQCKDKEGNDLLINDDLRNLIDRVLNRIQLDPRCEVNLNFFLTDLGDPVYFGSLQMVLNSYVGLPKSFTYKTRAEVDKISVGGEDLNLPPVAAMAFIDSLFISEKAKAFAIARQIFYANSFFAHTELMFKSAALLGTIFSSFYVRNFFQLQSRLRPWSRGIVYSIIGGAFYVVHLFFIDSYYRLLDVRVDKKAAHLTTAYAEGGIEYYTKLMLRNKIFHDNSPMGAYLYTATGNEKVGLIRQRHANLSTRLKTVKDELILMREEASNKENELTTNNNNNNVNDTVVRAAVAR